MTLWTMLLVIAAIGLLYVIVPVVLDTFFRYRPAQVVRCSATGRLVRVHLDATLAALTAVPGPPKLRVDECELWPEYQDCAQDCTRHRT